jgi:hypothetical protein
MKPGGDKLGVSHKTLVSFTDVPKMQTLTMLKSQKREVFETSRKAVPVKSLFLSYMEPICYVSRGKTGWRGTGKRDYRHRSLDDVLAGGKRNISIVRDNL